MCLFTNSFDKMSSSGIKRIEKYRITVDKNISELITYENIMNITINL